MKSAIGQDDDSLGHKQTRSKPEANRQQQQACTTCEPADRNSISKATPSTLAKCGESDSGLTADVLPSIWLKLIQTSSNLFSLAGNSQVSAKDADRKVGKLMLKQPRGERPLIPFLRFHEAHSAEPQTAIWEAFHATWVV